MIFVGRFGHPARNRSTSGLAGTIVEVTGRLRCRSVLDDMRVFAYTWNEHSRVNPRKVFMTSPNEPGRDDAEQRDGQDSAASTPAEEQAQAQQAAETPEQADGAETASAERSGDTEAAAEQESVADATTAEEAAEQDQTATERSETTEQAATERSEATEQAATEQTEVGATAAAAQPAAEGHEQASGLGEELASDAPKKKKTGLLVGAIAAGVLVLAAAGVGAYLLFAGPSAQNVAESYAEVTNRETQDPGSVNVGDYKPLVCNKVMPQIEQIQKTKEAFLKQAKPQDLEMLKQVKTSVKNVQADGDTGKVVLEQTVPGQQPQQLNLSLIKEDGWKLCA
jgi:flagellar basal body-associated protein FliL